MIFGSELASLQSYHNGYYKIKHEIMKTIFGLQFSLQSTVKLIMEASKDNQ